MMNVQEKTCCTRTLKNFLFEFCFMRRNLIKFSCDGGILTLESILTIMELISCLFPDKEILKLDLRNFDNNRFCVVRRGIKLKTISH